jgi:hypothetical protein
MTIAEFINYANENGCELRNLNTKIVGPRGEAYTSSLIKFGNDGSVQRTASVPDLPFHSESIHDAICGLCNQLDIPVPPGVKRRSYNGIVNAQSVD